MVRSISRYRTVFDLASVKKMILLLRNVRPQDRTMIPSTIPSTVYTVAIYSTVATSRFTRIRKAHLYCIYYVPIHKGIYSTLKYLRSLRLQ